MRERPPRDLLKPEYGDTDVRPDVQHADRQEARLPEAFILVADILGEEPLPFHHRNWRAATEYSGRYDFRTLLRGHVYRLAIPDIASNHALASRLEAQPRLAQLLGFDRVPARDTFRRVWNNLEATEQEGVTGYAASLRRRVAALNVEGVGALQPQWDDDSDKLEAIPGREKRRAVEHLRAFCYEQLGFERARNQSYHRDELLDLQAEVSREQGFVQGTIEDRWMDGEACHTPKAHFNAIENRSVEDWHDRFHDIYAKQIEAAKNAGMFQRPVPVHIDATIIPYYKRGHADDLPDGVTGNVKARGTHYGYKHVTISAQDNGRSVCLASVDVDDRGQMEDAVRELITRAQDHVDVSMLSMDSEFLKADLIQWIDQEQNIPVSVQMPRRGKRLKRALVQMTGHFDQAEYRLGKHDHYEHETLGTVVVERDYDVDEPDGPEPGGGLEASSLAEFGAGVSHADVDLEEIDDIWWQRWRPYFTTCDVEEDEEEALIRRYKRRWAIETKYRVIKDEFLGRTTSRDYTARTFFWLFACMLYNAWVLVDVFLRADYPDLAPEDRPTVPARTFAKQFFAVEYG